jgi:hypothetical protein
MVIHGIALLERDHGSTHERVDLHVELVLCEPPHPTTLCKYVAIAHS